MSLYVVQKRGSREVWVPQDPGQPNSADSRQELRTWSPPPEPNPCASAGCGNPGRVLPGKSRGYWRWERLNSCQRCINLRQFHGLELPDLVAMWEAQGRRCYRCSNMLTDPRLRSMDRKAPLRESDGTWVIRIDHDHKTCRKDRHSCERCRRGLACHSCNCHGLALRSSELGVLPKDDAGIRRWLEFLGPEGRDRLRAGLTLFPEQPARKPQRRWRSEQAARETVAPLFDLDAYRSLA